MAKYTVLIEKDEEGWFIADVPEFVGCHTQAKTMDELILRVREVISLCEGEGSPKTKILKVQTVEV